MKTKNIALALMGVALTACSQDAYEKGQGDYSLTQADMVEAHVDGWRQIDYVVTDDAVRLDLERPISLSWVTKADTVYRAFLYYNKVEDGTVVSPVACSLVSVPSIVPLDSVKHGVKTDPVRLESVWLPRTRRYINAGIYLKIGKTDDKDAVHHLGVVAEKTVVHADGRQTLCLRFYHDQGGMPEYYSQRVFFSIPLQGIKADSVSLAIATDKGEVVKTFGLR